MLMLESRLGRRTYRLKPSAYIHLGMCFSARMARSGSIRRIQIPLEHTQLSFTALDHKPMIWGIADTPTNFATEFLKGCHPAPLAWYVCLELRIISTTASSPI